MLLALVEALANIFEQGPQVYQSKFGPTYRVSYATSIGLLSVTVINILITWFIVNRRDKQRTDDEVIGTDGESPGGDGGFLEHATVVGKAYQN